MELRPSPPISASYLANATELQEFDSKQKKFDQARREGRPLPLGLTSGDLDTYRECILQRKDCLRDQCTLEQTLSEIFMYEILPKPDDDLHYVSTLRTRRDYLTKKVREWAKLNPRWVEKWQSVKGPVESWLAKNADTEKPSSSSLLQTPMRMVNLHQ